MTSVERLHLRSRDAVAECLVRHLVVPAIYFEAQWPSPGGHPVDVLAIDRAGSGDVHIVEIKVGAPPFGPNVKKAAEQLMLIPAQFRWVAVYGSAKETLAPSKPAPDYLYPPQEMGRVGIIVFFKTAKDELVAGIRYRAERFRGNLSKEADAFLAAHRPDIEFR